MMRGMILEGSKRKDRTASDPPAIASAPRGERGFQLEAGSSEIGRCLPTPRRQRREEKKKKVKERENTAATRRDRFSRYYSARANSGVKRAFRQIRKIKPSSFAATAGRKCREPRHIFIKYISRRNQPCTLAAFEGGCRVKFCARARRTGGSADFAISGSMKSLKIVCTAGLARCPRA